MSKNNQSFKRRIWDIDSHYVAELENFSNKELSEDFLAKICVVRSVESAKKRTPLIPISETINLIEVISKLPSPSEITVKLFEEFLKETDCWGAGIKTSICILAVLKNGKYPPLDRKIARAARKKNIVDNKEEKVLNGQNKKKIAKVYIKQILPLWQKELKEYGDPRLLDSAWGELANNN